MALTKQQAVELFGNQSSIARALGFTRGAISQWPGQLTQRQSDLIVGAALRLGKTIPRGFSDGVHVSTLQTATPDADPEQDSP